MLKDAPPQITAYILRQVTDDKDDAEDQNRWLFEAAKMWPKEVGALIQAGLVHFDPEEGFALSSLAFFACVAARELSLDLHNLLGSLEPEDEAWDLRFGGGDESGGEDAPCQRHRPLSREPLDGRSSPCSGTITLLRNEGVPSFDVAAFAAVSDVDEGIINVIDVPNPTEDLAACIQAVHDAAAQHEAADVSLLSAGTNAFAMAVFLAFGGRPASIDRTEDIVLLRWEEDEEERFSTQPFSMGKPWPCTRLKLYPGVMVVIRDFTWGAF